MADNQPIKLPMLSTPKDTLARWSTELRARLNPSAERTWIPFTIQFDNSGAMTTTLNSVITSEYRDAGDDFYDLRLHITATTSGVAANAIGVIPPFIAAPYTEIIGTVNDGTYRIAALYGNLENYWTIVKIPLVNYALTTHTIRFAGRFKKLGSE